MGEILTGKASDALIGGFLVAARHARRTVEEIVGLPRAMRAPLNPSVAA